MADKGYEFREVFRRLKKDIQITKKMLVTFFVVALLLRVLGLGIPLLVFGALLFWFLSHIFRPDLLEERETVPGLHRIYFLLNVVDFAFLTVITYAIGVSDWLGPIFFLITLAMGGLLSPKRKALFLSGIAFLFYTLLVGLEYFGVLPYRSLFPSLGLRRSPYFLPSQLLITGVIFYFIADVVGSFSEALRKRTRELVKERKKAEEALSLSRQMEKILKVRVRAKTRELRELTEKQEEIIEGRTEELEERVKELEKFRRLTVGRELKMIELKEEKERLEQKVEELQE